MGSALRCAMRRGHGPAMHTYENVEPLIENAEAWKGVVQIDEAFVENEAWARFAKGVRRLERLRRLWASLGHHLREIKQRAQ